MPDPRCKAYNIWYAALTMIGYVMIAGKRVQCLPGRY